MSQSSSDISEELQQAYNTLFTDQTRVDLTNPEIQNALQVIHNNGRDFNTLFHLGNDPNPDFQTLIQNQQQGLPLFQGIPSAPQTVQQTNQNRVDQEAPTAAGELDAWEDEETKTANDINPWITDDML